RISERPEVFEGTADLHDLPALEDFVADDRVTIHYKVTARLDPTRRKVVSCIIEGFVFLTCQTTLEVFRHEISISDALVLVDSESELPPIEEEREAEDYIVADGPIDVLDLVEEAVLLALPMVPRKPGLEAAGPAEPVAPQRQSPFAALDRLKKKPE
ncbi:MAG TPA: DUF177 domain-containing protein, partial [Usitatibacter sp.]|nr:DUF177 domain-containing protein [Usitatibacter sp.]